RDPESGIWHSGAVLEASCDRLTLKYPYGGLIVFKLTREPRWFGRLRNWLGMTFNRSVSCRRDDVTIAPDGNTATITVGFPLDEPIELRTLGRDNLRDIATEWPTS